MSLLLDALRKAEEERRLGQTPSLHSVIQAVPAGPSTRRRWLPWLLGLLGLALGAAALAVVWLQRPAVPATAVPAAPPAPPLAAPTIESLPVPMEEDVQDLADLDIEAPYARHLQATAPEATARAPTTRPAPPADPLAEASPAPQPGPSLKVERIQLAAAGDVAVPLAEMPADYRASFPAYRVDVHVWNEDPALRFVMLNGRRYREGDVTQEGPRLLAIVVDGMDFEHRGTRVRLPLGG